MFIAKDINQFKAQFVDKLKSLLSDKELGAFILVLANSQQSDSLRSELIKNIDSVFIAIKNNLDAIKQKSTQDDVDVFNQLVASGIKDIPVWQNKTIGHWDVSLNTMRQLRPARAASQTFSSIIQAFDDSKFHFNKPFLKPEILWQGSYQTKQLRVLYNKFPFSDYHLLIAVSPQKNLAQQLTEDAHKLIYSLAQSNAETFPGFGIGFNSLAAGASVNHLHFQGFIREQLFPVEKNCWQHNGGSLAYPLIAKRFSDAKNAWDYINTLTEQNIAFNCLYRKALCYVFPRKYQGTVELPDWLQGAGWLDVAGVITVSDEKMFNGLDELSVTQGLKLLAE